MMVAASFDPLLAVDADPSTPFREVLGRWFISFFLSFSLPRSRVFVRGFISVFDARLVKSLTISRIRCSKNSDGQFNSSITWRL